MLQFCLSMILSVDPPLYILALRMIVQRMQMWAEVKKQDGQTLSTQGEACAWTKTLQHSVNGEHMSHYSSRGYCRLSHTQTVQLPCDLLGVLGQDYQSGAICELGDRRPLKSGAACSKGPPY